MHPVHSAVAGTKYAFTEIGPHQQRLATAMDWHHPTTACSTVERLEYTELTQSCSLMLQAAV